MKKAILSFVIINFIILGQNVPSFSQRSSFIDDRDGKKYKTIEIDDRTWMAQNLFFESENSSFYNDKKRNGKKYGRLYTWNDATKACPDGWHLPSDKEWTKLIEFYGGPDSAGIELSIVGASGFDVRLSGFRDSIGTFFDVGNVGTLWTSTTIDKYNAWRCYFNRGYEDVVQDYFSKVGGLSVRCIKDE